MAEQLEVNPNTRVDHVGHTGIYPASGPLPPGDAPVRGQGELAHPEERRRMRSAAQTWQTELPANLIGRALFGGYFVYNGVNHFVNRQMLASYARSQHVPAPDAAVLLSGAMILLGGLSILTGVKPKVGASLISTFLLAVSPQMHAFWRAEGEQARMQEFVNFTKNMALAGAACLASAIPEPWPASPRITSGRRALA